MAVKNPYQTSQYKFYHGILLGGNSPGHNTLTQIFIPYWFGHLGSTTSCLSCSSFCWFGGGYLQGPSLLARTLGYFLRQSSSLASDASRCPKFGLLVLFAAFSVTFSFQGERGNQPPPPNQGAHAIGKQS